MKFKGHKVLVIGDTHDSPHIPQNRFHWIGKHIRKCKSCQKYTLKLICGCGSETILRKPPKFSPIDKYAEYRRKENVVYVHTVLYHQHLDFQQTHRLLFELIKQ